jgi:flagellar hook assembly protein FlgD
VYRLKVTANVNITIFDASRTVTRRLMEGVEMEGGKRHIAFWDGRNSRGDIVANGTYICVIESGSGEQIVLPVIVMKR